MITLKYSRTVSFREPIFGLVNVFPTAFAKGKKINSWNKESVLKMRTVFFFGTGLGGSQKFSFFNQSQKAKPAPARKDMLCR